MGTSLILGTGECASTDVDIDEVLVDYAPSCYNIDTEYDGLPIAGIQIEPDGDSKSVSSSSSSSRGSKKGGGRRVRRLGGWSSYGGSSYSSYGSKSKGGG